MKSKPAPRRPKGVVARFLAGESIREMILGLRRDDQWWGEPNEHIEAILRQALKKRRKG